MRVAFFGNLCNNQYQIANAIRRYSSIDAHLYINKRDDFQMKPESDFPELLGNYPDWIHEDDYLTVGSLAAPWRSKLTRELNQYDIVLMSYFGPIYAQYSGKPAIFYPTGSDLVMVPFPMDYLFSYPTLKLKLFALVTGFWQRMGLRKVAEFWMPRFSPYMQSFARLGLDQQRIFPAYFPLILDTERFRFNPQARSLDNPTIREMVDGHDFILFHPSRLMINPHPRMVAIGNWKRNDALIDGFARFVNLAAAEKAVLVMIDRIHSLDVEMARRQVAALGIEKNVVWIRPPDREGFTRDQLIDLYSASDVVADDFGIGWFGSIVLEGCSTSRPVISYIDEPVMNTLYPWHPVISARQPDEIAVALCRLYENPRLRVEAGQNGRRWVEQFHSPQNAGRIYVQRFIELAARLKLDAPTLKEN